LTGDFIADVIGAGVLVFTLFVLEENALNAGGPTALSLDRKPHGSAEGVALPFELAAKFRARKPFDGNL
jgi:hypothetical protein